MVAHGALGGCIALRALGPSETGGYGITRHVFIWGWGRGCGDVATVAPWGHWGLPNAAHFPFWRSSPGCGSWRFNILSISPKLLSLNNLSLVRRW